MMHSQVVGVPPAAPVFASAVRSGNGRNQQYLVTWNDNSRNETAFVVERRVAGSTGPWTTIATLQSSQLGVTPFIQTGVGPGTGTRTYIDLIGNTNALYEYQVYALNVVGDVWDYSDPAFNQILPGGGWPTLKLDSRGGTTVTVAAPSGVTGTAVRKNTKVATVTLNWTDNSDNETGFLIQRSDNVTFSLNVVSFTVGSVNTFKQDVARGKTYYYRVQAFNDTAQSAWSSPVATVTTP